MLERTLTFVAADPPRSSYFAAWDPANPGGLGASSSIDVELTLPAKRGVARQTVAAEKLTIRDAIDQLATLRRDDQASTTTHAWAAVIRTALALIAAGKVLPWVSPEGFDTWRVDPLDVVDIDMLQRLVEALPAEAHATPASERGAISDPAYAIRAAFDAIADTFLRTPAAHRVGSLRLFADPTPTKVPHLRAWVNDLAAAHCSNSRLVLRMHPPRAASPPPPRADESLDPILLTDEPHEPGELLRLSPEPDSPDLKAAELDELGELGELLHLAPNDDSPASASPDIDQASEPGELGNVVYLAPNDPLAGSSTDDHESSDSDESPELGELLHLAPEPGSFDTHTASHAEGIDADLSGQPMPHEDDDAWVVTFALQSKSDPSLLIDARDYWMAPTEVLDRLGHQAETTLLAGLLTVTKLVTPWSSLLDDVAPTSGKLRGEDLDAFLDQLDELEAADIDVRWPSELVAPKIKRQLVVSAGAPTSGRASTLDLDSLLDVDWEFLLDGVALTADELEVLARAKRSVVSLRGRWVRLDRDTVRKLRAPAPKVSANAAIAAALGADVDLAADARDSNDDPSLLDEPDEDIPVRVVGTLKDLVQKLRGLTGDRLADNPAALQAQLRDYQRRGLGWMSDLCDLGFGGCLADDMGLGKTIQVLALHATRRAPVSDSRATSDTSASDTPTDAPAATHTPVDEVAGPDSTATDTLSDHPASASTHESPAGAPTTEAAGKHRPHDDTADTANDGPDAAAGDTSATENPGPGPTLVICPTSLMNNWAREAARFLPDTTVHIFHGASRKLDQLGPDDIVVTSYGVVRSDAERLDSITWDLVVADEAQHAKNPRSRTARAIRQITSGVRIALTGTPVENNLSELWSIIDWSVPGLLGPLDTFRRTMALPIERDGDRRATDTLHLLLQPFLLRRTKSDEGIAPELPDKIERDVVVPLSEEQITLYKATTEQVLAEVAAAEGIDRRGLILKLLTGLKQITNHPAHYLGQDGPLEDRSGKLDALTDLLATAAANNESTLIFSQYVAMANLIVEHQLSQGCRIAMLHGGQSVKARQELVDAFQGGELDVLVLSLKAGGTGLNLTAATNVVHYDRWWNPAVEDQATDRAYRIGQTKTVTVHRIITEGTVEDRVAALLESKRELAQAVTGGGGGESWIGELDDDELASLVKLSESDNDPRPRNGHDPSQEPPSQEPEEPS